MGCSIVNVVGDVHIPYALQVGEVNTVHHSCIEKELERK